MFHGFSFAGGPEIPIVGARITYRPRRMFFRRPRPSRYPGMGCFDGCEVIELVELVDQPFGSETVEGFAMTIGAELVAIVAFPPDATPES
jgi:hypothetical protein